MLKYVPIIACTGAFWFLITTIYAMAQINSYTRWQLGELAACLLVLILGVKHAYHPQP